MVESRLIESRLVESRLTGQVRVVGVGLLGTSVGLGLRARGVDVILADASPTNLSIAIDYGAGRAARADDAPQIIVVCVPPDVTAQIVAAELVAYPDALVTDVASVKVAPLDELRASGADVSRYLGSHPLAGRERGGPLSGRADLFLGRPWVVADHGGVSYQRGALLDDLILDLGATLVEMSPEQHDSSVALVSHVPQVISSVMARRLADAPEAAVNLSGQGLRDVTRIAASDPELGFRYSVRTRGPSSTYCASSEPTSTVSSTPSDSPPTDPRAGASTRSWPAETRVSRVSRESTGSTGGTRRSWSWSTTSRVNSRGCSRRSAKPA
jgi:prephenate dehydrogenase